MSGHSKWATTHRQKELTDKQRSKRFSKIIREIMSAVKTNGSDINTNPKLRLAIQNAKALNMPKENIERAIHKNIDEIKNYANITYESVVGVVQIGIVCMTDNVNRTASDIRALLCRHHGELCKNGTVMYNFKYNSVFIFKKNVIEDLENFTLEMIEYDIEDLCENDEETYCLVSTAQNFSKIQNILEKKGIEIQHSLLRYSPIMTVEIQGEELENIKTLLSSLEDLDDIQNVFSNLKEL